MKSADEIRKRISDNDTLIAEHTRKLSEIKESGLWVEIDREQNKIISLLTENTMLYWVLL